MNQYKKLIIVITLLIIGFGLAILILSWPLLTGKTYVLATAPIDPFDLFRGQYIQINYEISRVTISNISESNIGDYIYVDLEKDSEGIYRFKQASLEKPEQGDFIRGKIISAYGSTARVEYGIEQYYFERGAEFSTINLTIEIKVSSSGQARIQRLLQDGQPINISYRENWWKN